VRALNLATVIVLTATTFPASAGSAPLTLMAPYVSALGVTKPIGSALDGRRGTSSRLDQLSRQLERRIEHGICRGCR
jgi:hypothetical protein